MFVIDATAGCNGTFPCRVRVTVSGTTETGYDFVTLWAVPDRASPLAALSNASANQKASLSGTLRYNSTISSPMGIVLLRFTSDDQGVRAGWTATWRGGAR